MERYPELDEYWVIARSENKLKELAEQHPQQKVRVVPLDLADTRSMETFEKLLPFAGQNEHGDVPSEQHG